MDKLLKKLQILQFIIIISLFIISNFNENNETYLNKDTEYYNFLLKIIEYNKITIKFIKKNIKYIDFEDKYNLLLKNNEYFYIFYNNNVYTYFFKEVNNDQHVIYFNGINNIKDIKIILNTIFEITNSNFNFESIEKLLNKKGLLYKIDQDQIEITNDKYSVLEVFDYLYNEVYLSKNVKLKINGFSLGGPISQLFTLFLLEHYSEINIDMYNVESWFGGNEEIYNKLIDNVNIFNIYNNKSIFYFFNIFFQKYFKSNYLLDSSEQPIINYNLNIFPFGIINYFIDNHLLSKILKNDK